jgi:hypothetical protein
MGMGIAMEAVHQHHGCGGGGCRRHMKSISAFEV